MLTVGDIKETALQLIDEYSQNARIIPPTDSNRVDYTLRMNRFIDMAQKELATRKRILTSLSISQMLPDNQLGNPQGFRTYEIVPNSNYRVYAMGSRAFYVEVDTICTIFIEKYVENQWVVMRSYQNQVAGRYTAFKDNIEEVGHDVQIAIRIESPFTVHMKNIALFLHPFPTRNDIPDYRPHIKYQLPPNFYKLKEVTLEHRRNYINFFDFNMENKQVVIDYNYKGSFEIIYYKYPETIRQNTPDSHVLEVDPEAQAIIPYMVAGQVIMTENATVGAILLNLYYQKLAEMPTNDDSGKTTIQDVRGW